MAYRNYAPNNGFIISQNGTGDFTTIQAGLNALATTGRQTLYLEDDTYNEDLIVTSNANLVSLSAHLRLVTPTVTINGSITCSTAFRKIVLDSIRVTRASGNIFILSNGVTLYLPNSFVSIAAGVKCFVFNGSFMYLYNTYLDNNGKLFELTNNSSAYISRTQEDNSLETALTSTITDSTFYSFYNKFDSAIELDTCDINVVYTQFGTLFEPFKDLTFLSLVNTTGSIRLSDFTSGTAASIDVDVDSNIDIVNVNINSSNANAISGTGSVSLTEVNFIDSSNVQPTIVPFTTLIGTLQLTNPLEAIYGGTGQSSYTTGDLLYASSSTTLSKLPIGSNGDLLQLQSGIPAWSTPSFPITVGSAGQIIRSDGTNWAASTATYPNTTTINQLLYSSSANTIAGLATAASSILVTSAGGVPSLSTTIPFTVPVSTGGTGATTLTGVLTGNGTGAFTANAVTQYGTVIAGASNAVSSVAPSATSGVPYISQGAASNPTFGTAVVAGGGTGVATFANTSALVATGTTSTGAVQHIASVATGQVLTSAGTSTLPAWSSAPSVTSITLSSGTALSTYVEGTWTPTVIGGSVAGITTYNSQTGYYTKVGNIVYVNFQIDISAATGTGNAIIGGLPFTVKNQTTGDPFGSIFVNGVGWLWPATTTYLIWRGTLNSTNSLIQGLGSGVATATLQMTNAACVFRGSMVYQV